MTGGPLRHLIGAIALCAWSCALLAPPLLGYGTQSPPAERAPWGDLAVIPIVISPPAEYIPTDAGPISPARWHFPGVTIEGVDRILTAAGFSSTEVAGLRAAARPDARSGGFVLAPDPALVRTMTPQVRARLYAWLAKNPLNFSQQAAYRFFAPTGDGWLGSGLSPRTRALVDPLIYRDGDFLYFADLQAVRGEIGNGPELQRLVKRLLRQATVLVTLRVDDEAEVDGLTEYWGRGGRRTDIRPLLESVGEAEPDQSIDITHLLPEMARRLLYRYPKVSMEDLKKPQLANCFWTALNFFNDEPDDRLLDPKVALERLHRDYFLVQDALQLGDIVALSDGNLNIFHVAVYIADDLVFTKNGFFSLAPWTILPIERLKGHFSEHAGDWRVTYYRRKDL